MRAMLFSAIALFVSLFVQAQPSDRVAEALLAKLPVDWREPARMLAIPEAQQKTLATSSDEVVRVTVARLLARTAKADDFVRTQVRKDPSVRVRTTLVQQISTLARWTAMPSTMALLEDVAKSDPDVTVSLLALDNLRRARLRGLTDVVAERLALAKASGDAKTIELLTEEQERWISLDRGTMLPSFLRVAPPVFAVKPADQPVRVLAFGDFGTGSDSQKTLAQTMVAYHQAEPLDFAITLGDNFYTKGMESTADPRWKTQWEDLYGPLNITFYAALGNHDWGFADSPAAEILYRPSNASWRMPASYYTYTAGPVQFFALDTQSVALSDKQLQWLDRELGKSTAKWKVVYGHHPIYSGGNYEDRPDLIARLLPVLRNRANIYICGHDHNLQALRPEDGVHFFVAGGGGAGLYQLRQYERSIFASSANGFAVLDADASRIKVTFVEASGKKVYETTIGASGTR
jgi:tartrate-resistant acid phosphatase type 5